MSPDWVVRLGADARLDLDPIGVTPGWRARLVVLVRRCAPPIYTAAVRIRPAGLVLEVSGAETAKWSFGIGTYEVWLDGPKGQASFSHSGRVLVDRR